MGYMHSYEITEITVPAGELPVWAVQAIDARGRKVDLMLARTRQCCELYVKENNLVEGDDE